MFNDDDFNQVTETPKEQISVEELDKSLRNLLEFKMRYEAASKASKEVHSKMKEAEINFMNLLERSGKDRWEVDGKGFSYYQELRHRVPQGIEDNEKFQEFLKSEQVANWMGQDTHDIFYSYVKVQSQSVNKLCNELKKMAAKEGVDLQIPGIMPPKAEPKIRALPKKK